MLKKKKTTASGKLILVKSVRRTRSHRMKFCVQRGLGALPSTSKRRGKSQRDFLLCGPVCINTGIAGIFSKPSLHIQHTICPIGAKPIYNSFSIIYADKNRQKSYGWRITVEIKKKRFAKIPCMLPSRQTHPYMQPLLKESGSMEKKKI